MTTSFLRQVTSSSGKSRAAFMRPGLEGILSPEQTNLSCKKSCECLKTMYSIHIAGVATASLRLLQSRLIDIKHHVATEA